MDGAISFGMMIGIGFTIGALLVLSITVAFGALVYLAVKWVNGAEAQG